MALFFLLFFFGGSRDSNPKPSEPQTEILTLELHPPF